MFYKLKRAFTLVELLVVMGVLAVLAAGLIAVLNPADRVNQANDTKILADISQVQGGAQAYAANNSGSYPTTAAWSQADLGTDLAGELTILPAAVTGRTYVATCIATGCKFSVTLLSNKSISTCTTQTGSACATPVFSCWDNTLGAIKYYDTQDATAGDVTCP